MLVGQLAFGSGPVESRQRIALLTSIRPVFHGLSDESTLVHRKNRLTCRFISSIPAPSWMAKALT